APGCPGNPVIGARDVDDIGTRRHRHVTLDAAILPALGPTLRLGQAASGPLVAGQALLAEIGDLPLRCGNLVGVVARGATETALARAEATAGLHLLDVPHCLVPPRIGAAEDCEERGRGEAGPIVERVPAQALDPVVAQQVVLLADGRAQR